MSKNEMLVAKAEFSLRVSQEFRKFLTEEMSQTMNSLEGIVTDMNIDDAKKYRFINAFSNLLNNELTGKKLNDAIDTTLNFVFSVRNNIFHGTKTVLDMMDIGQQERLRVYASILISINEMLFDAIEKRFEWTRDQVDTDLNIKKKRNIRNVERRFIMKQYPQNLI